MASQMNVATDNVISQCFYVKVRQIFGLFIHLFLFIYCVKKSVVIL